MSDVDKLTSAVGLLAEAVRQLKDDNASLLHKIDRYQLETSQQIQKLQTRSPSTDSRLKADYRIHTDPYDSDSDSDRKSLSTSPSRFGTSPSPSHRVPPSPKSIYSSRLILTTYPGQVGIKPTPLIWGAPTPSLRGPIIASRHPSSLKIRNAIGAHGGSYSIYRSLAIAFGELNPLHRPNLTNTDPVYNFPYNESWSDPFKIVSMDPYGHIVASAFSKELSEGVDIRPTIAVTKAHMRVPEISALIPSRLSVDSKIVLNKEGDLSVLKAAVEPVWYLPGLALRFGVDESTLRRCLFEETGGMYPELITRPDLKVFLPPIGGLTVYFFGDPEKIKDGVVLRIHDECNGSDVFGSDICTCRPYLIYGIHECVMSAQKGTPGIIVYFRKEGRALGEVTKYLVYNARKRAEGGDTAAAYFTRTENIAGVKDMRFQKIMPDVLVWMGVTKVIRLISMSNMKYDALVSAGIEIQERVEIPDEYLPPDSQVEIDAKIAAGYFSKGHVGDLNETKGRTWDDVLH